MAKRVLVAMSGGVDSSVTAALLKRQGYDVIGVTMRLWTQERPDAPPHHRGCCSIEETDDARRVAGILDMPYYVLNFEREFEQKVVDYFVEEYQLGRTPNPCLACNQFLKFDVLMRRALAFDCDYLATGHYGQVRQSGDTFQLCKAVDPGKDQSYVLYTLGQQELSRLLLPLGSYTKPQVRELAAELGLPVADKPDSQEICFLQGQNYREFLAERVGAGAPGEVQDESGTVLGRHGGAAYFTVGQRKGLGLATPEPRFVLSVDAPSNVVVVGTAEKLLKRELECDEVHWVAGKAPDVPLAIAAKVRYRSPESPATLHPAADSAKVVFDQPQRAITPGQAVVFYQGDVVLGGGKISRVA